jgi:hypothetical protein
MERFADILVSDELNASDIHRLENIITMDPTKHGHFNSLKLWLEATVSQSISQYFAKVWLNYI